jgi:hypothetical protein
MKFFLDTEFSDTGRVVHPISIGIVADDGREYYAEIASAWRTGADPWIVENVGKHLGLPTLFPTEAAKEIAEFIGNEPAEFWAYWAAYDWVVFCQVFGGLMKLPKNVSPWIRDLAWLDPSLERIRALKVNNPKPHHALYDARELREQYARLTASALETAVEGATSPTGVLTPIGPVEQCELCANVGVVYPAGGFMPRPCPACSQVNRKGE